MLTNLFNYLIETYSAPGLVVLVLMLAAALGMLL